MSIIFSKLYFLNRGVECAQNSALAIICTAFFVKKILGLLQPQKILQYKVSKVVNYKAIANMFGGV